MGQNTEYTCIALCVPGVSLVHITRVDGFDYYTIDLIAVSFCGAGKGDCPRWTIKNSGDGRPGTFLKALFSFIEAGGQFFFFFF